MSLVKIIFYGECPQLIDLAAEIEENFKQFDILQSTLKAKLAQVGELEITFNTKNFIANNYFHNFAKLYTQFQLREILCTYEDEKTGFIVSLFLK